MINHLCDYFSYELHWNSPCAVSHVDTTMENEVEQIWLPSNSLLEKCSDKDVPSHTEVKY